MKNKKQIKTTQVEMINNALQQTNKNISEKLIHRRLMHISPITINDMCKKKLLKDLPSTYNTKQDDCIICIEAKMRSENKGKTVDTEKLKIAELLHIDFKFFNITSLRGFTSILTIIDAKTRKLWVFQVQINVHL